MGNKAGAFCKLQTLVFQNSDHPILPKMAEELLPPPNFPFKAQQKTSVMWLASLTTLEFKVNGGGKKSFAYSCTIACLHVNASSDA